MSSNCLRLLAFLFLGAAPALVQAEVLDSGPGGFTVRGTVTLRVPPTVAYQKFVRNVADWWDSSHTFSRDAGNLAMDDKPGACLCEKFPDGGGVKHLEVVYAAPGKALGLRGAMGPMLTLGLTAGLEIRFAAEGSGTKVTYTYSVGGYVPKGANTWAAPVDGMLAGTFSRFETYANTGSPDGKPTK